MLCKYSYGYVGMYIESDYFMVRFVICKIYHYVSFFTCI